MTRIRAWHSTSCDFDTFVPFSHFGSRAQAEIRRAKNGRLIEVDLLLPNVKVMRDTGSWKIKTLQHYRWRGYDGIRYLNRYEGIPLDAFERARAISPDLDSLSDTVFQHRIPEASDSWIVFDPSHVTIVSVVSAEEIEAIRRSASS